MSRRAYRMPIDPDGRTVRVRIGPGGRSYRVRIDLTYLTGTLPEDQREALRDALQSSTAGVSVSVVPQPHDVVVLTATVRADHPLDAIADVSSSRSKKAIADLGVLDRYTGYLVRDDYAGWHQFDAHLAGVQQCVAHLFRHVQDVLDLHPNWQDWAGEVRAVLRDAHTAVEQAKARGQTQLDPVLLAELRARYDKAVHWGQITNRHRDWHKGNHPGYILARRLAAKAEQVWLFTTNFAVPWTNNASEQALKSPKLHQKVSGYWHTPATLARFCRVRSYLVSARNHGIRAIHAALTGKTWLPAPTTA